MIIYSQKQLFGDSLISVMSGPTRRPVLIFVPKLVNIFNKKLLLIRVTKAD